MGLAPLLVDTYRKYKNSTSNFVQWLAETARATGTVDYVFNDSHQDAVPAAGGRLKGAARKAAKEVGTMQGPTAICKITTESFIIFADDIARDKRASVPHAVYTTLRAVIRGRKDCATWYTLTSDPGDDALKKNHASHKHFIIMLETILGILKTKLSQVKHQPLKTTKATPIHTSNAYDGLEDEELSDFEDMPDIIESPARPTKAKVKYNLEPSDADVSFAIFCFLKDCTHLILAVRRTWREFAKGDIGLQAAALTLNAALAMIEKLSNEFEQAHPRFKDSDTQSMHIELIEFVYNGYSKNGAGPTFIEAGDDDSDPFAYKEGKQILRSDSVMCTHTTDLVVSIFWDGKNEKECRLMNDEKRFLKCVSQLASVPKEYTNSYLVHKAARSMRYDRKLNSWIVLSLQVFWDMQRELRPYLPVGKRLLGNTGQQIIAYYQAYLDVEGLERIGKTHITARQAISEQKQGVEALVNGTTYQEMFDECEK